MKVLTLVLVMMLFTSITYAESPISRAQFEATKADAGTTIKVPEETVKTLCGDEDGCEIRLAMSNLNNAGKTASKHTLFYYNSNNRVWQASLDDMEGVNANGTVEHVLLSGLCYFTDGRFVDFESPNHDSGNGSDNDMWLLSWNRIAGDAEDVDHRRADCFLTLID